ncbi:MAG: two pore domain potassium channel family protein, partial [Lactiplantibacillus plantarum]|nr:two pore domain potassium channel family protein [Lactiplantibacillus plantarum]
VGLMFGGIGFIGLLTSTITDFFTTQASQNVTIEEPQHDDELRQLLIKIDTLTTKVDHLQNQVKRLEKSGYKKQH